MDIQSSSHLFPLLNRREIYPLALGKILWTFYASNQKYFTIEELQQYTHLQKEEIKAALSILNNLGEVNSNVEPDNLNQFYIDIAGCIKSLTDTIAQNRNILDILEKVIETRDTSNQELNAFIKDAIVFNSEILDFIEKKMTEHFNTENYSSL